jgi:PleD family two-component response regulator
MLIVRNPFSGLNKYMIAIFFVTTLKILSKYMSAIFITINKKIIFKTSLQSKFYFLQFFVDDHKKDYQEIILAEKSIIAVDDHEMILEMICKILEKANYHTLAFKDARNALSYIDKNTHSIGLIISDISMPNMTGLEFLDALKSDEKLRHIPILFLSAFKDEKFMIDAFNRGAVDFITKPIRKDLFVSKIKAMTLTFQRFETLQKTELFSTIDKIKIDDVMKYIEDRNFSGFLKIDNTELNLYSIINFYSGALNNVKIFKSGTIIMKGSNALELIRQWKSGSFFLRSGSPLDYQDTSSLVH